MEGHVVGVAERGRTETRLQLFENAGRTDKRSKEIVRYQGGGPPEPLLRR